jgi:hypothetical protein
MDIPRDNALSEHVLYIPKVIPEANALFIRLRDEVPWREIVWRANRKLPRLCCNSVQLVSAAGELLQQWLMQFFRVAYGVEIEIADIFGNYYRSGNDWLPYHRDQYGDLHVVSMSFGITRRFNFQGGNHYDLAEGDIIAFDPHMNEHYTHGIPKQPKVKGGRINLTCFVRFSELPYGKPMRKVEIPTPSEVFASTLL